MQARPDFHGQGAVERDGQGTHWQPRDAITPNPFPDGRVAAGHRAKALRLQQVERHQPTVPQSQLPGRRGAAPNAALG